MHGLRHLLVACVGLALASCANPAEPAAAPEAPFESEYAVARKQATAAATAPVLTIVAEVAPEPEPEAAPEPEPEPTPFEGLQRVRVSELIAELDRVADELAELPTVRADYDALVLAHGLTDTERLYRDYVRIKLAFESTRDGGLWHLQWDITNEKPNSEQIWRQWKRAKVPASDATPTAIAECDELSALFAFIVAQLGVRHVGLYWPTWNHVVAVWTVTKDQEKPVRIVVPTSQIFLTHDDSLGTEGFDPWSQRTIYEYRRRDVKGSHVIDVELARFFVTQARRYAGLPQLELQRRRNAREHAMSEAPARG